MCLTWNKYCTHHVSFTGHLKGFLFVIRHQPSFFIKSLVMKRPPSPGTAHRADGERWDLQAGSWACRVCLILLQILEGKFSSLNYPLPQGWQRLCQASLAFPLSVHQPCFDFFLLSQYLSILVLFCFFLFFFFFFAVSNNVSDPAVKIICQRCLKFNKNILVSTKRKLSE